MPPYLQVQGQLGGRIDTIIGLLLASKKNQAEVPVAQQKKIGSWSSVVDLPILAGYVAKNPEEEVGRARFWTVLFSHLYSVGTSAPPASNPYAKGGDR